MAWIQGQRGFRCYEEQDEEGRRAQGAEKEDVMKEIEELEQKHDEPNALYSEGKIDDDEYRRKAEG